MRPTVDLLKFVIDITVNAVINGVQGKTDGHPVQNGLDIRIAVPQIFFDPFLFSDVHDLGEKIQRFSLIVPQEYGRQLHLKWGPIFMQVPFFKMGGMFLA